MWIIIYGIYWLITTIISKTIFLIIPEFLIWFIIDVSVISLNLYIIFLANIFFAITTYFLLFIITISLFSTLKQQIKRNNDINRLLLPDPLEINPFDNQSPIVNQNNQFYYRKNNHNNNHNILFHDNSNKNDLLFEQSII